MARFSVLCRVDAFIDYLTVVEANSAEEAASKVAERPEALSWYRRGQAEFDARAYFALDADGNEIPSSQCGDF